VSDAIATGAVVGLIAFCVIFLATMVG